MKTYAYESDIKARYSTDYISRFSEEWNEAVRILQDSKVDLSKIIIVEKQGRE
jgi:hypothetical protein